MSNEAERKAAFDEFIARGIASRPVEAKIIRKVFKACTAAGNPVVSVSGWHGEDDEPVSTLQDVYDQAFNLDELVLHVKSGAGIALVMGNEYDLISDYSTSLEDLLTPVNKWIEAHW